MTSPDSTQISSPWHAGEITLQRAVGVAERMAIAGQKVIRDHMPDQHREFYAQLPFLVAGAVDVAGDVWATLLTGAPGFAHSPDPRTLAFALARNTADPADAGLNDGDAIGLLGIELHSRRRNRMNGRVRRVGDGSFAVHVEHSFGNCPQYIQLRDWQMAAKPATASTTAIRQDHLDDDARAIITTADTFFVASYLDGDAGRQVDVSHRGGKPGFVRIDDDGALTIPDFAGNLHFNTLGNFLLNPRAGLTFVDFATGDMLQMTGEAEVILESPEIAAFQGAERLWRFRPRSIVRRPSALPLRWTFRDWSANSLMTGSWEDADSRLAAQALASQWRPFRVARIVVESAVIRSFHLEPVDGAGVTPYRAGQHLPIRLHIPGETKPVLRTYTLSSAPSDPGYRISVRRQGLASNFLHDQISVGDLIEARAPGGDFTIDAAERRPAVLIGAGVGVTPMLAMLRHIVYEGLRTRRVRPTVFIQAARTKSERAFDAEIAELVARADGKVRIVRTLEDTANDAVAGIDVDVIGRVDMMLLRQVLGFDDHDFYLCGPPPFMQALYDGLRDLNIADNRIHAEAFGPASLSRRIDSTTEPAAQPSSVPVPVAFAASAKEARWSPGAGSLLDLAEARGLAPEFSCRGGSCGTCRTRIIEGAVAYPVKPSAKLNDGEALICCAVPADKLSGGADRLILDL